MQFGDKDEHIYFWFPLLAGLSELTFDPRPDIRHSALEVSLHCNFSHCHITAGVTSKKDMPHFHACIQASERRSTLADYSPPH